MKTILQKFWFASLLLISMIQVSVAQCDVDGGILVTINPTTICVDGVGDPINISLTGNIGAESGYIITDLDSIILGLPVGSPFDLDGAGIGKCLIWHVSHDGTLTGDMVGNSLSELEGCFDLSNDIAITRQSADGGVVSLLSGAFEQTYCAGDVLVDVIHANTSTSLSYAYVITDSDDNILGFQGVEVDAPLDLSGAPVGECHIWGWSYLNENPPVMGENISTLQDGTCESVSTNFITITRIEAVEAPSISTMDDTTICVDGQADPINVELEGSSGDLSGWVITDAEGIILAFPETGPFDLDGAGEGVCMIYYINFESVSGLNEGLDIHDLTGCFKLSNAIAVTREAANGGTVALAGGGTTASYCAGDVMFDVTHETTASNLSYAYVITDNNENILGFQNIEDGNTLDLSGAPAGECHVYGWSYLNENLPVIGENITTLQDGSCESVTSDFITITRIETTEDVSATTISTMDETTICVDGVGDPIAVDVEGGSGINNAWIITDAEGMILALPLMGPFDLDGAGEGVCQIYYLNYEEVSGLAMGMNTSDLEGCYALSNAIAVTREAANGGTVALAGGGTTASYCAGDVMFDVTHETTASNLSYAYVITDNNENILGFQNIEDGNTLDLSGAPAGECHVYGWSYLNENLPVIGENITTLQDGSCESVTSDFITITRIETTEDVSAATISTMDETTICVDGVGDPITVDVEGGSGINNAWIITDAEGMILALPLMGPFDLDGAGEGVCQIYYLNYEEVSGLAMGMNTSDLEGCYALSNAIAVTREAANGGTVALAGGGTTASYCAGDVMFDVTHETTASNLSYAYVITDNNENILGFQNIEDGNTLDLSGAPVGECHVYGWSYKGEEDPVMGENISTLMDGSCESVSTNFIAITRLEPAEPAVISTEDETTICVDGLGDPITVDVAGGAGTNSAWVITDGNGTILGLPAMGPFDLDGAGEGVCNIYYLIYETVEGLEAGLSTDNLSGCFAFSNPIAVTRQIADGGTVALTNGLDTATYCVGEVVFDVMHETTATALDYSYVIADIDDNILGFADGPTLDLSAAPEGECHVYGWSSDGEVDPVVGEPISSLDIACGSLSANFIRIFRTEEACPTSTQELDDNSVSVYPNPAVNFITIEYKDLASTAEVHIYDMQGRLIIQDQLRDGSGVSNLDIQNLQIGMYMVKISSEESIKTQRIIVTR